MPHCSSEHDEQFESMVGGASLAGMKRKFENNSTILPKVNDAIKELKTHFEDLDIYPTYDNILQEMENIKLEEDTSNEIRDAIQELKLLSVKTPEYSLGGRTGMVGIRDVDHTLDIILHYFPVREGSEASKYRYKFEAMRGELYEIIDDIFCDDFLNGLIKSDLKQLLHHFDSLDKMIKKNIEDGDIDVGQHDDRYNKYIFNGSVFELRHVYQLRERKADECNSVTKEQIEEFKTDHPYFHSYHNYLIASLLCEQIHIENVDAEERTYFRSLYDLLTKNLVILDLKNKIYEKNALKNEIEQIRSNLREELKNDDTYYKALTSVYKNRLINVLSKTIETKYVYVSEWMLVYIISKAIDFAFTKWGKGLFGLAVGYKLALQVSKECNRYLEQRQTNKIKRKKGQVEKIKQYIDGQTNLHLQKNELDIFKQRMQEFRNFLEQNKTKDPASQAILSVQREQLGFLTGVIDVLNYKSQNITLDETKKLFHLLEKELEELEKQSSSASSSSAASSSSSSSSLSASSSSSALSALSSALTPTPDDLRQKAAYLRQEASTVEDGGGGGGKSSDKLREEAEKLEERAKELEGGDTMETTGGAPKRTSKKHTKKGKTKMLKGKSKKHLTKAKKSKKTGKKVRFHSASKKSKKNTRKRH